MNLTGKLKDFPIFDIVQFLIQTKKTGMLEVRNTEKRDYVNIYCEKGKLIHAENEYYEGKMIFTEALKWRYGEFAFYKNEAPSKVTIKESLEYLLLESKRNFDQIENLERQLPSDNSVLYLNDNINENISFTKDEWKVLSKIDGRKNIRKIYQKLKDELKTKKIIKKLLDNEIITDSSNNEEWYNIIPIKISLKESENKKSFPSRIRTNLLLKKINGKKTFKELIKQLKMSKEDFLEDMKFLYEYKWIKFHENQKELFLKAVYDI